MESASISSSNSQAIDRFCKLISLPTETRTVFDQLRLFELAQDPNPQAITDFSVNVKIGFCFDLQRDGQRKPDVFIRAQPAARAVPALNPDRQHFFITIVGHNRTTMHHPVRPNGPALDNVLVQVSHTHIQAPAIVLDQIAQEIIAMGNRPRAAPDDSVPVSPTPVKTMRQ